MEQRIMEVLRRMQPVLEDEELRELKNVLHMVFAGCDVAQKTEVQCVDDSWRIDLEDGRVLLLCAFIYVTLLMQERRST